MNNTEKQTGPLDHYLLNSDFTNVMQELHSSALFLENRPSNNVTNSETVLNLVGVAPSVAPVVCNVKNGNNVIPNVDDNNDVIHDYLQKSFPAYTKSTITLSTFPVICTNPPREYNKFPIFKTSYRNCDNVSIAYSSSRPDWEPYEWFFSQISWTDNNAEESFTYCELAIAAHILTGGATAQSQDLCTKISCMRIAFKRFYQNKVLHENAKFSKFFQPHNTLNNLTIFGAEKMSGIRRRPLFNIAPDLMKHISIIVWKAAQKWQGSKHTKFGEAFFIKDKNKSMWTPDSVLWLYSTMERRKQDKLASSTVCTSTTALSNVKSDSQGNSSVILISSVVSSASAAGLLDTNKNDHAPDVSHSSDIIPKTGYVTTKGAHMVNSKDCEPNTVCFYGHKVSSAKDYRGSQMWRFSPSSPPWLAVPPARPLCQRCYLFHRASALRGESQYSFMHLFIKQKTNPTTPAIGGSSSSTARPPG